MFEVGDYVIYGSNGVYQVVSVGTLDISGVDPERLYYTLQSVYVKNNVVYTAVESEKVRIRKVVSKEEALELIDDIPNIELLRIANDKLREVKYRESMMKGDCREWIKVIKTLYLRKKERLAQGKRITNVDEKYLHEAEESLYGELSIPLKIGKEEMEDFITSRVEALRG